MTVRDFKLAVLSCMKDKIDEQRAVSMAVGLAIAAAFDSKATNKANKSIDNIVRTLEQEQEALFMTRTESGPVVNKREIKRSDDGGLDAQSVDTWRTLSKIDAAFSKMTGRLTGAPWSKMTMGNKEASIDHFKQTAEKITGEQIMDQVARGAQRASTGRIRPGRRKK